MSSISDSSVSPEVFTAVGVGRLLGRQRRVEQQVRHAEDAVERRPDLVRDDREEARLGAVRRLRLVAGIGERRPLFAVLELPEAVGQLFAALLGERKLLPQSGGHARRRRRWCRRRRRTCRRGRWRKVRIVDVGRRRQRRPSSPRRMTSTAEQTSAAPQSRREPTRRAVRAQRVAAALSTIRRCLACPPALFRVLPQRG